MEKENEVLKTLTVLLRASSSVEKMLKADMMTYGLNATEFVVMELLYNKGKQPIQMISKKILLASSSITYVIDRLEEKGFVQRIADLKDRRVTFAQLTEKGYKNMEDIFPKHTETIEKLFEELSDEEINQLKDSLKKIGYTASGQAD